MTPSVYRSVIDCRLSHHRLIELGLSVDDQKSNFEFAREHLQIVTLKRKVDGIATPSRVIMCLRNVRLLGVVVLICNLT